MEGFERNVFGSGGTGFSGKPLTRALLRRGWQVTLLTRSGQSTIEGVRVVKGDITERESLRAAQVLARRGQLHLVGAQASSVLLYDVVP